jgi:tetratricopeptide (TPR) repeat protein
LVPFGGVGKTAGAEIWTLVQVLLNCLGMTQKRAAAAAPAVTPELLLRKATLARTAITRAKYAQRGLAHDAPLDHTTRVLLLRQLYLSHMEGRRFADALSIAEQMLQTSVMPDVARQDAARACLGLGDREKAIEHLRIGSRVSPPAAIEHLRIGSRVSPPARRAFHLWTLGSVLYLEGRYPDACGALSRAARWGTTDKPLYLAGLGLARLAAGEAVSEDELAGLRERLSDAPCGQGYGQFVLGELCFALRDHAGAVRYLRAFLKRVTNGRVALQVSLSGEIKRAKQLIRRASARLG